MTSNLAALLSLAIVFGGSFVLSTQDAEAKASRSSSSKAKNYFVPPPPPYTPSMVPSTLAMTDAQVVTVDADGNVVDKPGKGLAHYIFTHKQGAAPQGVQPSPGVTYAPHIELKIQKQIDSFDSEILSVQEEIGKLLNL